VFSVHLEVTTLFGRISSVFQNDVMITLMLTTLEAIERFAPLEKGCYVEGKCFQFTWK
jgi:hypothetical protein